MVQLIALRPLAMDRMYHPGELFQIDENTAAELEKLGLVERWYPPEPTPKPAIKAMVSPENKMESVVENKAKAKPARRRVKPRGRPRKK